MRKLMLRCIDGVPTLVDRETGQPIAGVTHLATKMIGMGDGVRVTVEIVIERDG